MANLDVVTVQKKKAGSIELSPLVFDAPLQQHLLHAEVRRQLARRQRGTASTKNRHAVSGGGSKPWRQKGTGRARQGSTRSPQWAGGGVVFGPVPRSHAHALPKRVRRAALRIALSQRVREGAVTVIDALEIEEPRTKRMVEILRALALDGESVLIVIDHKNPHVERSARNLPGVTLLRAEGLNVYDVLRHAKLLITKAAAVALQGRLSGPAREASS